MDEDAGPSDKTTEFVRLLNRHERRLMAYVASLVPHWADAEEIVQETRVRLWRQFSEYDSNKDFGAWACAIAHYQVLTYRKRVGRQRARFSDALVEQLTEQFAAMPDEPGGLQRALTSCLEKLTGRNREILRAFYASEATIDEMAQRQQRSASAIYKALATARGFLYACIERTLRQEHGR